MEMTTDDIHDSEVLPNLIMDASRHRLISEAYMDGAYDSIKSYRLLRRMGVKPIIKPRRNARADRDPPERRLFSHNIQEAWGKMWSDGLWWALETAFSTFKRLYEQYCMSKNIETIARELAAKAYIYNMLINLES